MSALTLFRPCIDLHGGRVKQIVGSTLETDELRENFVADKTPDEYARLFSSMGLYGGHVIMLGPGNTEAALCALRAFPGGMSVGGGINETNAQIFLENGASHVIVTSALFEDNRLSFHRAKALAESIGPQKLIFDLSCVSTGDGCHIACDRWRTVTDTVVSPELFSRLEPYCAEFLVHAVGAEGKRAGADASVVDVLCRYAQDGTGHPVTYAGGLASETDVINFMNRTKKQIYFTVGSALDIYGGDLSISTIASL